MAENFLRYPSKRAKKHTLSYAWYEEVGALAESHPQQPMVWWIGKAHRAIYNRMPGVKEVEAIIARLNEEARQSAEASQNAAERKKLQNVFGATHTEWLKKITPTKSCLLLADFDITQARYLYNEVDKTVIDWMIAEKTELLWHGYLHMFEAVMFGFGSGYGDKPAGDVREFDLNESDPPAALMRSLGLGPVH